jgi:hypothetical protein
LKLEIFSLFEKKKYQQTQSTDLWYYNGTPTKRHVSKRQVSKRPGSKRLKRQVYKTSALKNVRFTKRQVFKTSGCKKNIHIYSVLVVGGNPQVLLQPCLLAKRWLCFILYFRGFFAIYQHN